MSTPTTKFTYGVNQKQAYEQGRKAYREGRSFFTTCHYGKKSSVDAWEAGFHYERELAKKRASR